MSTDTEIAIESGIPIPKQRRENCYPADFLDIGQSFLVPKTMNAASRSAMASGFSRRLAPKRFIGRTVPEGTRIWRVA